ncbi:MAG: hypothetical protein U9Q82_14215 [Chloroflexota bacterium]|nr:hypothetical protein [Chloroflexota bacterium]
MRNKRGSWYLLTGVLLGITLGLLYAWVISPTQYRDTTPVSLHPEYKDIYRAAIASSFSATGDLKRATARLALLHDDDPVGVLAAQSQRYLAEGYSYTEAQALANLSAALEQSPESESTQQIPEPEDDPGATSSLSPTRPRDETLAPSETVSTARRTNTPQTSGTPAITSTPSTSPSPTLSRTPLPTFTPLPTRTLTPTLSPPFVFANQALFCDPDVGESQLRILVTNSAGEGVPGVEIIIQWDGGEDRFFTGLKPEMGWGYADYVMAPQVDYSLHIANGGESVDISSPECSDDEGERYWGSWQLTFTHP